MRFRRTIGLTLVMGLLAVPTTAMAIDDTGGTDRPATSDATTDATTDRATDRRGFEAAKERALDTIAAQLRVLDGLATKVGNSRFITDDHAAILRGDIATATQGLEGLARQIEEASNWEELRPLLGMIDDWKIAQVLAPKTGQVIASDALVALARKAATFASTLETVIQRFEEAGFDVDEAWRMLEEVDDSIAAAERLADPVAENVIGLDPEDWPDPASSVLAAGRADLHEAGAALRSAKATAGEIVHLLRSLFDGQLDVSGQTDA